MVETKLPSVVWAQRKDKLYVTIDLQNAGEPKVTVTNGADGKHGHISFRGKAQSHATGAEPHEYAWDIDLYGPVDPDGVKVSTSERSILLVIPKKEEGHWPRLQKDTGKTPANIKVDWDKWVDEDEEEDKPEFDLGDMQNLQNFGGGGAGGMDFGGGGMDFGGGEDSDDDEDAEDLPDLEKA
jgi:prostaglandin-E synthase